MTKNTIMNDQINTPNAGNKPSEAKANFATFGSGMAVHLRGWLHALQQANDLLPSHLRFEDVNLEDLNNSNNKISLDLIKQLEALPVFSLSVVVHQKALINETESDKKAEFEAHIADWATNNPLWQIIKVPYAHDNLEDPSGSDRLTSVFTYRYVLMPIDASTMQSSKKAAAARMLDDGITSHLRQFIETLPITSDMGGDAAIDCHIVSLAKMLRPHRLVCFDMDSTLIEQEVIVELAKHAGIGEQVSEITESAMRGEIDFDTSFSKRVALLQNLSADVLDDIQSSLTLSPGARTLLAHLKNLGYHTMLVSGGFTYFANKIAQELGIDEVYANDLDIEEGCVTGNVNLPIVNGDRKAALVEQVAERLGIDGSQVVCVGDGANDLPMMAYADLGIAYHAKPIVRSRADAAINATGLEGALYVLGYAAQDLM